MQQTNPNSRDFRKYITDGRNQFCIEIWAPLACFTRPEFKVERVSYDVMTPSAARNIMQSIFWKPAIRWQIDKIEVLNPIKTISIMRNEVKAYAKKNLKRIAIEDHRTQRRSLMLRDVRYRIYATLVFIPVEERNPKDVRKDPVNEVWHKYAAQFVSRATKGQCFTQPYLGLRECMADGWEILSSKELASSLQENASENKISQKLGFMIYDIDYSDKKRYRRKIFNAELIEGILNVPAIGSDSLMIEPLI